MSEGIPYMITVVQASEIFGISKWYVRKLVKEENIRSVRAGNKILISSVSLIKFLNGEV